VIIKWRSADVHDTMWTTHLKQWTEGEAKKIEFRQIVVEGVADTK
jgi:hypothetical protein